MEDNTLMKEVYFSEYCPLCEHENKSEGSDPCHDCLQEPARVYSHKPAFFKEKQ